MSIYKLQLRELKGSKDFYAVIPFVVDDMSKIYKFEIPIITPNFHMVTVVDEDDAIIIPAGGMLFNLNEDRTIFTVSLNFKDNVNAAARDEYIKNGGDLLDSDEELI